MNEVILKSVKEFFRVAVLAVIPVLILGIESGVVDWRLIGTVGAIAGLKFVDKLLHEWGKETNQDGWLRTKGLTNF